jgi:4'-phosphopantetheinyl transferase
MCRDPGQLQFRYGAHGKPALTDGADDTPRFNISHSGDVALLGICEGREIGVDIEFWRDLRDEEALARRYFSVGEVNEYCELSPGEQTAGFFNCWSRKEAYIKALGRGLSLPLAGFQVSLAPGREVRLVSPSEEQPPGSRWSLAAVQPFDRCSAAVVVEGETCHISNAS